MCTSTRWSAPLQAATKKLGGQLPQACPVQSRVTLISGSRCWARYVHQLEQACYVVPLPSHLCLVLYEGPNAIHVLESMGVLDSVLTKVDKSDLKPRPFRFLSGLGEHEFIYDVCFHRLIVSYPLRSVYPNASIPEPFWLNF